MTTQQINTSPILSDLLVAIQHFNNSVDAYLDDIGEYEILNPFQNSAQAGSVQPKEQIDPWFFEAVGIRKVISSGMNDSTSVSNDFTFIPDNRLIRRDWRSIKNELVIEKIKSLFSTCSIIQFADWTSVYNASDLWDGLLSDVIRPLNKRDFHFIFRLGDPVRKLVFETDEIIDIIGDYSNHGRVTLVLNENEADSLRFVLNGWKPAATSRIFEALRPGEYLPVFNDMSIDELVILYNKGSILFDKEGEVVITGKSLKNGNAENLDKDYFSAGYQLGLLLELKIPHCLALGQAVSGIYAESESNPNQDALVEYIKEWMMELEPVYVP
jgi:hypothetical protein